jgi:hypothetical protein
MDPALFLARILSLFLFSYAMVHLFRPRQVAAAMLDICDSPGLMAITGFFYVILGCVVIVAEHRIALSHRFFLTVFGHVHLFKGLFRLGFPEMAARRIQRSMHPDRRWITTALLFGSAAWFAFIVYRG